MKSHRARLGVLPPLELPQDDGALVALFDNVGHSDPGATLGEDMGFDRGAGLHPILVREVHRRNMGQQSTLRARLRLGGLQAGVLVLKRLETSQRLRQLSIQIFLRHFTFLTAGLSPHHASGETAAASLGKGAPAGSRKQQRFRGLAGRPFLKLAT